MRNLDKIRLQGTSPQLREI